MFWRIRQGMLGKAKPVCIGKLGKICLGTGQAEYIQERHARYP
jgi:hypothetical protein